MQSVFSAFNDFWGSPLDSVTSLFAAANLTFEERCERIGTRNFSKTTILNTTYIPTASDLDTHGSCLPSAHTEVPLCRILFVTRTSETSAVHAEAWFPDEWYGRFLTLGNGGLGGCIDYHNLAYGSQMHFAVVASDNGHDGNNGTVFLNNPEVLNDFGHRSIHNVATIGKQLTKSYYSSRPRNSYYLGCSTGGRQGIQAALQHPKDFDGILAGAPAVDFNRLMAWSGLLTSYIGAPHPKPERLPHFISPHKWQIVSQEIQRQCDALDGIVDGIISDPDACNFRPEALLCTKTSPKDECLTLPQVEALRKIYSPLYGLHGELLYPRYDPGAEQNIVPMFTGNMLPYTVDWLKYVVYNDTNFDLSKLSISDLYAADAVDGGGISTFDGDFSAYMKRGGKLLSYHGTIDRLIALGNSKRLYNLISRTLSLPNLESFYRLFIAPGMDHCGGGSPNSPHKFGQYGSGTLSVKNDSSHNILLALVDWVEGSVVPDVLFGGDAEDKERRLCSYPETSRWDAKKEEFVCV